MRKSFILTIIGSICLCLSACAGTSKKPETAVVSEVESNDITDAVSNEQKVPDNIESPEISFIHRVGQYGINSPDPALDNYYYAEFLLDNVSDKIKYVVDFYYDLDNGIGSGSICVDRVDGENVSSVEEDFEDLDKDDNLLHSIVEYSISDDYVALYQLIDGYFTSKSAAELLSDRTTAEELAYMYSEEGIKKARDNMLCVD